MVHNAFHHEHSHGRAFHNHEARHMLEAEIQDSHIKMNVPRDNKADFVHDAPQDNKAHFIHNVPQKEAVKTVYTQVKVTETPGAKQNAQPTPNQGNKVKGTPQQHSQNAAQAAEASYLSAKSAAQSPNAHEQSTPARQVGKPTEQSQTQAATTRVKGKPTENAASQSQPASSTTTKHHGNAVGGTPVEATHGPTAVGGTPVSVSKGNKANLISQNSDGMSSGAKAGLAIAIIAAIALCGGLIFYCWRRRKTQQNKAAGENLDEKHASQDSFFGGMAASAVRGPNRSSIQSEKSFQSSRTATTAPQLSLRPVTQFLPNIGASRKSSANALDVPAMSEKPKGWGKPSTNQQNPFDDAAVISEKRARSASPPANPFEDGDGAATGKPTPSHSQKNSWEDAEPMTPSSTKFGTAAAVPIAAAAAPNGAQTARGPNNVHRVQLDFKPSMDDELELRSGQLVRMLHEYDDGWTLCIRMDRSQQGVCPRTCLSKLPVKPRPQGPPPPNGPSGRPMGPPPPGMRRPASPQMTNGMVPRPLTPTGRERSHTLGRNSPSPLESASRPRSQSMGGMAGERPMSPSGLPPRKPVPGQAL